ncbi:NaeI family type II restriction endonuclease [Leucobacter sp. OH1287]|uniref:NaeI family type II restriction endonuclease n=1 Tax=Leucobacter sp. OH1287 TaxID=2491049 RepID=UPI003512D9FE
MALCPPNALLRLPEDIVQKIMSGRSGQQRVNELFRTVLETRITRNIVATVAQQDDYMKRVRANGGARSILAAEGILILSGDYKNQQQIAKELDTEVPQRGELVSVKVAPSSDTSGVLIQGTRWIRVPMETEITTAAPIV